MKSSIPRDILAKKVELKKIQDTFAHFKKKPWSPSREKTLGSLSTKIKNLKESLQNSA